MIRTNEFVVMPETDQDRELLYRLLDGAASLWNQLTFARRQQFFDGEDIWAADRFYDEYKGLLGSATAETMARVNDRAWRAFFSRRGRDSSAQPPGYWGNEEDGRDLRLFLRNRAYSLQWGQYSRIEFTVGREIKPEYGLTPNERPRVPIHGNPKWKGTQGELQIVYDDLTNGFRAYQSVTVDPKLERSSNGGEAAALDVGAVNLVACATTKGVQFLYDGTRPWEQFEATSNAIAQAQSKLPEGEHTSKRINRLYRRRSSRRDHCVDALLRDLVERVIDDGIQTIYVGDLTGVVRRTPWKSTNRKLTEFWANRRFTDRLGHLCDEHGIELVTVQEFDSSQECPDCGTVEGTTRDRDRLRCRCGYEGHADLTAARTLLSREIGKLPRPMARPVRFQWDNHRWRSTTDATA
ncbi:RNA-guided endonuclease InsQ/TnpB family protein [Haloplanus natans]|uniref:RNA-guided endonuclease InsQ/TnpB family protein n=1 Tax=Haloplanus natans TaxID=376171 RepID=UPI0006781324|nr:RNA-guided endonuclease TnpB family protein [Haloplanus natans]